MTGRITAATRISNLAITLPQVFILLLMVIVLSIFTPKFASVSNLLNILTQVSVIAIISCGLTLVVVSGCL